MWLAAEVKKCHLLVLISMVDTQSAWFSWYWLCLQVAVFFSLNDLCPVLLRFTSVLLLIELIGRVVFAWLSTWIGSGCATKPGPSLLFVIICCCSAVSSCKLLALCFFWFLFVVLSWELVFALSACSHYIALHLLPCLIHAFHLFIRSKSVI